MVIGTAGYSAPSLCGSPWVLTLHTPLLHPEGTPRLNFVFILPCFYCFITCMFLKYSVFKCIHK